ncbi:PTS glucose transporter subunit IIA [Acetivibrio ethanolgignens]
MTKKGRENMLAGLKGIFGKKEVKEMIGAPIKGRVIPLAEVPDEAFAQEILGKGVGICPEDGLVVAPCDGEVTMVFDTKHAISLMTKKGAEVLIHIGLDTVNLRGEHFTTRVAAGDKVTAGMPLIEFDRKKIEAAGYEMISPVIVCNSGDFSSINTFSGKEVERLEGIIELIK